LGGGDVRAVCDRSKKKNVPLKTASTIACAVLPAALLVLGCLAQARTSGAAEVITLDFDAFPGGAFPTGFSSAVTGGGGPASWMVIEDVTAPSGGKVLAQTSTDRTSFRFPLCVYDGFTAPDVTVSVSFRPVSGTADQAAGLVARYRDKDNYYVVRANALENNVRLYKVERGNRKQFAGANVKVPSGEWQTLTFEVKGTHFRVLFDDALLFQADDGTFKNAGKVGLWTKADSVIYFDDLRVKTDATR
jgi:Beta xylosidase C-terminal Concanavalin A-like domain